MKHYKFSFLFFVLVIASIIPAISQITVTIGTATTTTRYNPLYSFYGYNYTQQIYTPSEITAGGATSGMQITALRFYWDGSGNLTNTDTWTVFMGNTSQSTIGSTTDWVPLTELTEVFNGSVSLPASAGWMTINLTTPYIWTGDHLAIAIDENIPGYGSTANWQCTSTSSDYRTIYYYSDGTNPDPASPPSGTRTYDRPNIQLDFISLTPCSGTPEAGNVNPAAQQVATGTTASISLSNYSSESGLSFQWQGSSLPSGPFTNIAGATSSSYTTNPLATDMYYQCIVTCDATSNSDISDVAEVTTVAAVNMHSGSITSCGIVFYDSGGESSQYSSNENYTLTVYPDLAGAMVQITFNIFNIENGWDDFYIYDGNSTSAPLVGSYTGSSLPPSVISTATDGSLTFVFESDGSVTSTGWEAEISCYAPCSYIITETISDAPCFGTNGSANIIVESGGVPPYSINWQDGSTSFTNNNIPANTDFAYTITDANLCPLSYSVIISEPDLLEINLDQTDVSCYGLANGSINGSNISGGTLPYTHIWSTGSTNDNISSLDIGTYSLTVTDANSCTSTNITEIYQPEEILIVLDAINVECGAYGGQINSTITNAIGTSSFLWSNGETDPNITNLALGEYTLSVTDGNSCTNSERINIESIGNINVDIITVQHLTCTENNIGIMQAETNNGALPVSAIWNTSSTNLTINNLVAGNYSVTLTDNWGCTGFLDSELVTPADIIIDYTLNNISCFELDDGNITLELSGGEPPFSTIWSTSSTDLTLNNLSSGAYSVSVTDSKNCLSTDEFIISEPEELSLAISTKDVSCFGLRNGEILINASGGIEPYLFSVSVGSLTNTGTTFRSLAAGEYSVMVQDNNNCIKQENTIIYQPSKIDASISYSNPSCIGMNDGSISAYAIGGTSPYTYTFNDMVMDTPIFSNLREGTYSLTIQDINSCTYSIGNIILDYAIVECIDIPNAFTPNSDGVNDKWEIRNLDVYPGVIIYVYNRWGQEVYNGRVDSESWDGTYNGNKLPKGAYQYIINTGQDNIKPYTGTISLVY